MTPDAQALAYRRLACAILRRAVFDARSGNGHASEARHWLRFHPWAGDLLDALDLDRERVTAWVGDLEPLQQLSLNFDN